MQVRGGGHRELTKEEWSKQRLLKTVREGEVLDFCEEEEGEEGVLLAKD